MDRATALALAEQASAAGNAVTAEAIRRQLGSDGTGPARAGGVAAFHRIDRAALGPYRSKTEALYARRLELERAAGRVLAWEYEAFRFKLADAVTGGRAKWFKADFLVWHAGGAFSADEVKGGWTSDAGRERFRWLCQRYARLWVRLWRYEQGVWTLAVESGKPEEMNRDNRD